MAEDENTHWYYPINDGLTTTTVVVDASGVIATQLFGPYGQTRWAGGTMPTSYGFTGQRSDVTTGLDYYGARYYDPLSGCFTSADTVLPGGGFDPAGLNRYGYVSDNPETLTDPTGHDQWWKDLPPSGGGGNACPIGVETCGSGGGHSSPGGALWSKSCGSLGEASCSPGGSNVNACLGKSHCVILINGGPNSIDAPSGGENGFESDINGSWQQWIDSIYALYGGDVGFIVMETSGSDSSNGADLIHTTLASLGAQLYNGSISLIGASAGAGAVFQYLDKAGTGLYYSGDPIISSFVALDAPVKNVTSETLHFPWCLADACIGEFAGVGLQEMGQNLVTHWGGDLYYVEKYVQDHHVRGLYEWTSNDPISSEVNGGGLWKTREYSAQPGNAHEYIESQYPDSDVLNTLCPTCP